MSHSLSLVGIHLNKIFNNSQEIAVKVRSINDLVRFTYFSHKKLGFSKPVLFISKQKGQCISFIFSRENAYLFKGKTIYYSINQCKDKPRGYLYTLTPAEKIQTVKDDWGGLVEDKSFVNLISVKAVGRGLLSKAASGENLDLEDFLTRMNKAINFLEFARISTYYQEPVFVCKIRTILDV